MGKKLTEAKKEAIKRYDAANTKQIMLKLNLKTDADILARLQEVGNTQGYIKILIREDIAERAARKLREVNPG